MTNNTRICKKSPKAIKISYFSKGEEKIFQNDVCFEYDLFGRTERTFITINNTSCHWDKASKEDIERKIIPEQFFTEMTGIDFIPYYDFSLLDKEDTSFEQKVAPEKIKVEYQGKTYEYAFDVQKYKKRCIQECHMGFECALAYNWNGESAEELIDKYPRLLDTEIDRLGKDCVIEHLNKMMSLIDHIIKSCCKDSEGCTYNSIAWKDGVLYRDGVIYKDGVIYE